MKKQKKVAVAVPISERQRSEAEILAEIDERISNIQYASSGAEGIADILYFVEGVKPAARQNPNFNLEHCVGGLYEAAQLVHDVLARDTDILEREVWALRKERRIPRRGLA